MSNDALTYGMTIVPKVVTVPVCLIRWSSKSFTSLPCPCISKALVLVIAYFLRWTGVV